MVDLSSAGIQAILFAFFAGLTGIIAAVIGPTYDGLVVPALDPAALYPALPAGVSSSDTFLSHGAAFSTYLVANLVDPAIALVGVGVALAYLGRALLGRWAGRAEPLFARLVLSVLLANFTIPLAGAVLAIAGSAYPVIAGWDHGRWQHWVNLGGFGGAAFAWDNGLLAFVISFALFSLVLLLATAIALRNALLAVLLVLLPAFTLLWPIPALAPLARRAWLWFGELAFLPCVLVIPLELAVGAPNILLLLGYLTVAVASPGLISVAGNHLSGLGFPSAGAAVTGGIQRGMLAASRAGQGAVGPIGRVASVAGPVRSIAGIASRSLGGAAFPAALPILAGEFLGHGTAHLVRHLSGQARGSASADRFPPSGGRAGGGWHGR